MRKPIALWTSVAMTVFAAPITSQLEADVRLPSIFGSHMVLQRDQTCPIWGWADPGEKVTVVIASQSKTTTADPDGKWRVEMNPMPAGGPHQVVIEGKSRQLLEDVLVGEVWLCSGQSNMQWAVNQANDADLETMTAKFPNLRLITVPNVGTQEPQDDFVGEWHACTPETVGQFSAVGYFFGRQLHQTLDVPIGMIDNAWGGSACEAWVRKDLLQADEEYAPLLQRWKAIEQQHAAAVENPSDAKQLQKLDRQMGGQHRPANLYCGVLRPIIGFAMRGTIWYQGESNAGRAYQYRKLFPLMIQSWRDEWGIGDFSFYWVQLADFKQEVSDPSESSWAELREAQTMTMDLLPNTGEAVIIDLGEGRDIHPRNKQDVGRRLARWALAIDYGVEIDCQSPRYQSMSAADGKITLKFDHVGPGLYTFDVQQPVGFTIADEDKKFTPAQAKLVDKDKIEVWSDGVANPVAVRYAWADNPVANVETRNGLPLTPFRTDDWPGVTADKK